MKILFDARILLNTLTKNSGRSGIFWVVFNLIKYFNDNNDTDIELFFEKFSDYSFYLNYKKDINEIFNIKCFNDSFLLVYDIDNKRQKFEK